MTRFFQPAESAVEVGPRSSKWDRCTIVSTGKEYRPQGASGRTAVLKLVTAGMTVGELVALAAEQGFKPDFTRGAIVKHHDSGTGAWKMEGYDGMSIEDLKKIRQHADPAKEEARQEKKRLSAEAKAAKKAERDERREAKKAERAEKRRAAKEAKEAAKAAAAAEAGAQAGEAEAQAEAEASESKPKRSRKGKKVDSEAEAA